MTNLRYDRQASKRLDYPMESLRPLQTACPLRERRPT